MTRPSERAANYLNWSFRIVERTITSVRNAYTMRGQPTVFPEEAKRLKEIVGDVHNIRGELHALLEGGREHLNKQMRQEQLSRIEEFARAGDQALAMLTAAIAVSPDLDVPDAVLEEARRPRGFWRGLFRPSKLPFLANEFHDARKNLAKRLKECVADNPKLDEQANLILTRMGASDEPEPC